MEEKDKLVFAGFVIGVCAILQGIAWLTGRNGQVFAFTSLVIGGISGAVFGFTYSRKEPEK